MASPEDPILKALRDADRGRRNLAALHAHLGDVCELIPALARLLPRTADPDMALNNLERLFAQPAARPQLAALLEARGRGLEATLNLLATSQFFADTLATYPEFLEAVRLPPRRSPTPAELVTELRAETDAAPDDSGVLRAIRRFPGPLLVVHGSADEIVPLRHAELLLRSARTRPDREAELLVIEGGRHSWLYESPAYRERVAGFLAHHLGGPFEPVEAAARAAAVAVSRPRDREGSPAPGSAAS